MANNKTIFNWQLYLGFVLVVTGGLFLADQLLNVEIIQYFWPLLIVLFGLTFFVGMLVAGKRGAALAIPGTIITTIGIMFFIQNSFDLWVTWAYAWTLLISATGLGMLFMNIYLKRVGLRRVAGLIIGLGLTLFVLFGVIFEVFLDIAGTDIPSGVFLGAGFMLLGLFVVFSRALFSRTSKKVAGEAENTNGIVDARFKDVDEVREPGEESVQPLNEDAEFTGLNFKSVGEVFLLQGESCELKIEGSEDLLKKVKAEVLNGMLAITYQSEVVDWSGLYWIGAENHLRYFVTVKELKQLSLAGAGSITAKKLEGETLKVAHSGVGKMTLLDLRYHELDVDLGGLGEVNIAGEVQTQNVDLSGAGSYQAENLQSQEANISLSGAGSARVWVESKLEADVSGAGNIKYKGNPSLARSKTGLGSIKPL